MRLRLRILDTSGEVEHTLDPPGGLLGRSTDSTIHLPYDSVSRQHAELRHDGQGWWLQNRSQTSPTLLEGELVSAGSPKKLGARGVLTLGRIQLEFRQDTIPREQLTRREPAELGGPPTLILPRHRLAVPQSVLAQMSPVRVAEPEPPSPPPTLVRQPAVPPAAPPAQGRPTALESSGPPTLIRANRVTERESAPAPPPRSETPLTIVRKPASEAPAIGKAVQPPPPPETADVASLRAEVAQLKQECGALRTALDTLKNDYATLERAKASLDLQVEALHAEKLSSPATEADPARAPLREKALELLAPFSRSLEQAGEALREGNSAQARAVLRTASFALADLRDLFQS